MHATPDFGKIDLAANIRILVLAGRVGTASTLESTAGASSIDCPRTVTRRSSYRHLMNSVNHPGVSGDFVLWEGWSHVVRIAEEVPAGVA